MDMEILISSVDHVRQNVIGLVNESAKTYTLATNIRNTYRINRLS